jgi:O-antigen/teichoic acid export membrane protein
MSGTGIAQIIAFALMPVVSRLFTNGDFGIFGSFNSVLSVLSAFVTLQYSQAIVLPKWKEEAINLFLVSSLSTVSISLLTFLAAMYCPITLQSILKDGSSWFLFLLPAALLAAGLNQSLQAWSIRNKEFRHTALSQIIRLTTISGSWIMAGIGQMGAVGLACGVILGCIFASLNLAKVLMRDIRSLWNSVSWKRIKNLFLEFRDFPIFSATQNLMNALSQGLPVLMLSHFYGVGTAGLYAFGMRVLMTPMELVQTALRQVLFQKASETHNSDGDLRGLFLKTTGGLLVMAIIPCAVLFVWSPQIFSWIFGKDWWEAGVFARWLTLWMLAAFCNVPSVLFGRILRKQRNIFFYECIVLLTRTTVLLMGGIYWTALQTIVVFSALGLILNASLIVWVKSFLPQGN